MPLPDLPVVDVLPQLRDVLKDHTAAVLEAPPGAGKSTIVPLALLGEPWLAGRKLLMLEPRRIAARSIARRMAALLGEEAGQTVGYRTRLDVRVSTTTRIEVVTEGILTRMLQDDPALEDTAAVIFDEFHERSLEADLGLALTLEVRSHLREDLRILVMSATLAADAIAALLQNAAIVRAAGRSHPVTIHYRERPAGGPPAGVDRWRMFAAKIADAISESDGDLLAFLPGVPEIHRTSRLLAETDAIRDCDVLLLHGSLSAAEQDRVLAPAAPARRRVVLATNVAETSLTIEGVRVVVDSGLERRAVFDPATGMSRLVTQRISRASADQRCGRAGRTAPGVCYRFWTESEHRRLAEHSAADILGADLAPLALELAIWGSGEPDALRWLDPPPAAAFEQARDLLRELGALDTAGRITSHGRRMARLGTHPRLAHMLLESVRSGHARLGAEIAALLSERDLLGPYERSQDVDLRSRLEILHGKVRADTDDALRRRVQRSADLLQRRLGEAPNRTAADPALAGQMLASAYPDRIAQSRGTDGRYLLSSGRGAVVTQPQALTRSEYLVVADLDAGGREARIQLAAPLDGEALEALFADRIVTAERIEWNERDRAVVGYRESRLGALVLERRRIEDPDPETVQKALFEGLRRAGLDRLNWSREARALAARVEFVRDVDPDLAAGLPPFDRRSLLAGLEDWLAPWTTGARRLSDLERVDLHAALLARLSWAQRQRLDELAPSHLIAPSGSRLPIDYSGATPVLSARLQELFGMMETPRIADGRVPLMIELLSPARRPVQLTSDLASFWSRTYQEVRRELAGRYPRHYWPEDPLTAEPTARAKPRARRSRGQ